MTSHGGRTQPGTLPTCPSGLTVPVWGCPHCHTSHTRGSADTRGRSGTHRSSGTVAPSAHCRTAGVGVRAPAPCRWGSSSVNPAPGTVPVIPASTAPVWVPGQVGGKQEAGVGGLAPGALARVGQAVLTGQSPGAGSGWPGYSTASPHPWVHPPTHSLDPARLTGCRVGDTPLDSLWHPDPGPAGCMPHLLCGWCSDATHRRGPGSVGQRSQNPTQPSPLGSQCLSHPLPHPADCPCKAISLPSCLRLWTPPFSHRHP